MTGAQLLVSLVFLVLLISLLDVPFGLALTYLR